MFSCSTPIFLFTYYQGGPAGNFASMGMPWMFRTPGHLVKSQMLFLGMPVTKHPT